MPPEEEKPAPPQYARKERAPTTAALARSHVPSRWTAVHEASHVGAMIAAELVQGFPGTFFQSVRVRTPAEVAAGPLVTGEGLEVDCWGLVDGGNFYRPHSLPDGGRLYMPDFLRDAPETIIEQSRMSATLQAIVHLAGPYGEAKRRRVHPICVITGGGAPDWSFVQRISQDWSRTGVEERALRGEWERATKKLLRDRILWQSVLAFSELLLERRAMTGSKARAFFLDRFGDHRPLTLSTAYMPTPATVF